MTGGGWGSGSSCVRMDDESLLPLEAELSAKLFDSEQRSSNPSSSHRQKPHIVITSGARGKDIKALHYNRTRLYGRMIAKIPLLHQNSSSLFFNL